MTLVSADIVFDLARPARVRGPWIAPAPVGLAHVVNSTRWGGMEARTLDTAQWQTDNGHHTVIVTPPSGVLYQEAVRRRLPVEAVDFDGGDTLANLGRMRAVFRHHRVGVADFHTNRSLALGVRDLATLVRTQHVLRHKRCGKLRLNKEFPFDGFILSSQAGADVLLDQGYLRGGRVDVVGEWAHERFFAPQPSPAERALRRVRLGVRPGDLLIGAAAMLRPDNAFDDLIRMTARLRADGVAVSCLVVGGGMHLGDGPGEEELALRRLAQALGVADSVHFLGHRTDVPELLSLMDVVAVVSRHTAQTRVAPEAAARGRPVVAFDVGALRETIREGRTGLLAPAGDVGAFTQALRRLLQNPQERDRLGAEAARLARDQFTQRAKMDLTLAAYRQAMMRRRRGFAAPAPDLAPFMLRAA